MQAQEPFKKAIVKGAQVAFVGCLLLILIRYVLDSYVLHPFIFPFQRRGEDRVATALIKTVYAALHLLLGWAIGKTIGRHQGKDDSPYARWALAICLVALSCSMLVNLGGLVKLFKSPSPIGGLYFKAVLLELSATMVGAIALSLVAYCGYRFSLRTPTLVAEEEAAPEKRPSTLLAALVGLIAALFCAVPMALLLLAHCKLIHILPSSILTSAPLYRMVLLPSALAGILIGLILRVLFGGKEKRIAWLGAIASVCACEIAVLYFILLMRFPSVYELRALREVDFSYLNSLVYLFYNSSYRLLPALWIAGSLFLAYRMASVKESEGEAKFLSSREKKVFAISLLLAIGSLLVASSIGSPRVDAVLFQATIYGERALAVEALSKGANIEAHDGAGRTPLLYAAMYNKKELVRLLLEKGADMHAASDEPDQMRRTPIDSAVYCFDIETFELFMARVPDEKQREEYWVKFLEAAVFEEKMKVIDALLQKATKPAKRQKLLDVGLLSAFEHNRQKLVEYFLKKGANIDAGRKEGLPATIVAVSKRSFTLLKSLIKEGANLDVSGPSGQTALHFAIDRRNQAMVSLLLESGANINAQDDAGKTPLMYAIKGYNEELIKELLKNGADLTLRDKDGESALSLALASHMARIVDIIMKYQKGWSFAELIRVLSKKEVLKLTSDRQLAKLVELCVDFYPASENSKKLVEQCVRQKKSALLHQLLKKGVDPNMTIHNGKPLLDLAKELKAEEVVYVLEEAIKGQGK